MTEVQELVLRALMIGIGATAVLDLWAVFQARVLKMPAANFRMLGRWIGHFPRGQFLHENIASALPVRDELAIGWAVHFGVGIVFATLLVAIMGIEWARQPTFLPALIVGVVTVVAPFFIMQPSMGAGIAASKTPNPNTARLRSLVSHTVFGIGLYVSAVITVQLLS